MSIRNKIILLLIVAGVSFGVSFLIKAPADTFSSTIGVAGTIIQAICSLIFLWLAVSFFDQFGIKAKMKGRQFETVLLLKSILKRTQITVDSNSLHYLIQRNIESIKVIQSMDEYRVDKNKILLFPKNIEKLTKELFAMQNNTDLPVEIRDKLAFFIISGVITGEEEIPDSVKLNFNGKGKKKWYRSIPQTTFEQFIDNVIILLNEIDNWIKQYYPDYKD